jgi:hypothetical protein
MEIHVSGPAADQLAARLAGIVKFADTGTLPNDPQRNELYQKICTGLSNEALAAMPTETLQKIADLLEPAAGADMAAAERRKVAAFADRSKDVLAKLHQTPTGFVAKFSEVQAKRPGLTAKQYCGV